jgi:hypothetical protein
MNAAELVAYANEVKARHEAEANYEKTLALLVSLKVGGIALADVRIVPGGWQIDAPNVPAAVADGTGMRILSESFLPHRLQANSLVG